MDQEVFSLLSRLWLSEPDDASLASARALLHLEDEFLTDDPSASSGQALAVAYTDLFLLNVYPYASVFLDPDGEMNGIQSQEILALYQSFGCRPETLDRVGAPDHIGLLLDLLAHVPVRIPFKLFNGIRTPPSDPPALLSELLLDFAPVLCLAVERQPGVHPFYRALAVRTRQELFRALAVTDFGSLEENFRSLKRSPTTRIELPMVEEDEERSLSQIVHHLLCPARSGMFLSRNRLGQWAHQLGVPLAFGERRRLGFSLFEAAGLVERLPELLEWLELEVDAWDATYAAWAEAVPAWTRFAAEWRERTASTRRLLRESRLAYQTEMSP